MSGGVLSVVQGTLRAQQQVAQQLHQACLECGFFYVRDHGLSDNQCQRVLQDCREWFSLPVSLMLSCGWLPCNAEHPCSLDWCRFVCLAAHPSLYHMGGSAAAVDGPVSVQRRSGPHALAGGRQTADSHRRQLPLPRLPAAGHQRHQRQA